MIVDFQSPNWNERPEGAAIDTVVLHYTGMRTGAAALERLCDPVSQVSAHYLIEEDGRLYQLVAEDKRAWHAGVSSWRGRDNLNHNSIGIELVNPGHEFGYREFPAAQIDQLLILLQEIRSKYGFHDQDLVGHSDIAPDRKNDPGELFPWRLLHDSGFGFYSSLNGSDQKIILEKGQKSELAIKLNKQLGIVGYHGCDYDTIDGGTEHVLRAFQARWRPQAVTGQFDRGTAIILEDLAGKLLVGDEE